jgi:hypothetical protein
MEMRGRSSMVSHFLPIFNIWLNICFIVLMLSWLKYEENLMSWPGAGGARL